MRLKLTTDVCSAAYRYLCETEPFVKWNMPDPEDITFKISRARDKFGECGKWEDAPGMWCSISEHNIGTTDTLMRTMAHEMIHIHLDSKGMKDTSPHGRAFQACKRRVCAVHGWDPKAF